MDNENALKKQKNKTIDMITDDQTKKTIPDVDGLKEAVDDVPADREWTEEQEGNVAPTENAGTPANPVSEDMRDRFAKTHDFDPATLATGQKSSGKHDFGKTDKPADTTPAEE